MGNTLAADLLFKAEVVNFILSKDTEEALELLSQHCKVVTPNLKVGMPKRHLEKLACYAAKNQTIHISSRMYLGNPHVILHEFYHHLRNFKDAQRGIEKYAQRFPEDYLQAYRTVAAHTSCKE